MLPYVEKHIAQKVFGERFIAYKAQKPAIDVGAMPREQHLHGKLVTSGALILMFAFLVLSTSPGYEIKPLAMGLAAGIILDATVIRALLVPATMKLLGNWNWYLPRWLEWLPGRSDREARREFVPATAER